MCTAISFCVKDHYFGRNLDLEYAYNETVTVTARNFPLPFRLVKSLDHHYAMIGMATVSENYPLYYDATNEYGLSMAGLNFPGNAVYLPPDEKRVNITPYEMIPWILGQCKTLSETRSKLRSINIVDIPFSSAFPLTPLHWMVSDKTGSIVIEPGKDGIRIFDDPVGVLTNNPPFEYHMHNLCNYLNLTREEPVNRFSDKTHLSPYSRGMGAVGLPGDLSSASRFVKAAFTKLNSVCDSDELSAVSQFFHILGSVAQQRGCVKVNKGYEKTVYTSCCNTNKGIYYYTTYENSQITAIKLFRENSESDALTAYPLITTQQIRYENEK